VTKRYGEIMKVEDIKVGETYNFQNVEYPEDKDTVVVTKDPSDFNEVERMSASALWHDNHDQIVIFKYSNGDNGIALAEELTPVG
jgi:hypothetical protein